LKIIVANGNDRKDASSHLIDVEQSVKEIDDGIDQSLFSSCFTIACKLESRRVPDTNSLLSLFDARYHVTPNCLNHGEKHLLTQLDFELGISKIEIRDVSLFSFSLI
jgi:hypothetical protein